MRHIRDGVSQGGPKDTKRSAMAVNNLGQETTRATLRDGKKVGGEPDYHSCLSLLLY